MWRRAVLWQASTLLLVSCTLDVRYYTQKRIYTPASQVDCFDYPEWSPSRYPRATGIDWFQRPAGLLLDGTTYSPPPFVKNQLFSRRTDLFKSKTEDIVKEHAKLVQDINSLKQALFVAPMLTETGNKDYDDSIYLEEIETTTTTTPPTTSPTVVNISKKPDSSIPIILVGGASQRTVIKSQPLKFMRPTVSLVGTSVSPFVKHPYPFIVHTSSPPPLRICMPSMPQSPIYRKPKPNLLQRILNGLISR